MIVIEDIIADEVLESAYEWLCRRQQDYPPASDIWSFRQKGQQEKTRLQAELVSVMIRYNVSHYDTLKITLS